MTEATIKVKCSRCGGTGVDDNQRDENGNTVPESCTQCGGTGWVAGDKLDITDIIDKLNDIKEKVGEIKTVVDGL